MATTETAMTDITDGAPAPAVASEPVAKRTKTTASAYEFELQIQHLKAFRQLIEVCGSVLRHIFITVTPRKTAGGGCMLSVDSIDPHHVCMVQARLVCDGTIAKESVSFCIEKETLSTCLKNVPKQHLLHISQKAGSAEVEFKSVDGMTSKVDLEVEMSTFDEEPETIELDDLDYEFLHETHMPSLKEVIKFAKDINCDLIKLTMLYDGTPLAAAAGKTREAALSVSGKGTAAKFSRNLTSCGAAATGSTITTTSDSTLKVGHSNEFSLDFLIKMLKAMEDQYITLKMGNELPLLMHYSLGVEDSYVRFVLAPQSHEE